MASGSQNHVFAGEESVDAQWYVNEYPDVARSSLEPAEHYRLIGKLLGRAPSPLSGLDVSHVFAKRANFSPRDEVALLLTHAPAGRLKPHVLPYMKQLKGAGLAVALVVVVDNPLELLDEEISVADSILVRKNAGYDFGAWAHALKLSPALFNLRRLILTNDSVIPTASSSVFSAMMDRVRASKAHIAGLTANHEYGWHLQSYFLVLTKKALTSSAFRDFFDKVRRIDDKDEVIRTYEIPFSAQMRAAGLSLEALYHGPYPNNPVIWSWRELVESGFPFIKLLLLRKAMASYTDDTDMLEELHEHWPAVLETAGFDVNLVRVAIRAADMSQLAGGPIGGLLMNPQRFR